MTTLRRIGTSTLETPALVLGGNVFGWTADRAASFAVLDAFVAGGGRMIDTADVYSVWGTDHVGGESETVIGAWLRRRGRRDDVLIASKAGMLPIDGGKGLSPDHLARAIDASLARLGTDYIDLYYAHQDDDGQDQGAVADAFDRMVKAGKVRALGASNFVQPRLASALAAQDHAGATRYAALQNQYNLLDRVQFDADYAGFCVAEGVAMLPYSGLASGYLSGKYRRAEDLDQSPRGSRVRGYLEGRGPELLAVADAIAEETGATLAQLALAWLAAQPGVVAPIASATRVRQVEELVGALAVTLTADQLARLSAARG